MKNNPKNWPEIRIRFREIAALEELREWLDPLLNHSEDWPPVESLNHLVRARSAAFPWQFVKQETVPRRAKTRGSASLSGYLQLILDEKKIPIREFALHDILNAVSFMMFPLSKAALNARHRTESPHGLRPGQNRTRTQDLLTIFDEGGVVRLISARGGQCDVIFGHAVYEHIIEGKGLRAARLDLAVGDEIIGKTRQELLVLADKELSRWLMDPGNCRSAHEFSSLEFR